MGSTAVFRKAGPLWPTHHRVGHFFSWVASRLRNRPDSEHELVVKSWMPDVKLTARGNEAAERSADARASAIVGPSRPLSILVAGDNRANQKVIAKILEHAGHRATIVDDCETMLDVLDVGEFDVVLMDVNMPVMNGIEATKLYRFVSLGRPYLPIVAVMTDAPEEQRRRCKEAGMDAWITMPIERHRLLEIIRTLVNDTSKNLQTTSNANKAAACYSARPGNRTAPDAAVDLLTLNALENLGDTDFVDRLAAQFLDDASDILHDLIEAMISGDARAFGEQMHILCNASANIGARGIYEMCSAWGQVTPENLASQGETQLKGLHEEFERVCVALRGRLFERNVAAGRTENVCDRLGMHAVHTA